MASLMNISMAHHEEPQISLHLLAAIPHGLYVEVFPNPERDPLWSEIPSKHPRIADRYMYVPDAPGFAIPLRAEMINGFRSGKIQKVHV